MMLKAKILIPCCHFIPADHFSNSQKVSAVYVYYKENLHIQILNGHDLSKYMADKVELHKKDDFLVAFTSLG